MTFEYHQLTWGCKRNIFVKYPKKILSYIIVGICTVIIYGFACFPMNFQAAETGSSSDQEPVKEDINGQNPKGKNPVGIGRGYQRGGHEKTDADHHQLAEYSEEK